LRRCTSADGFLRILGKRFDRSARACYFLRLRKYSFVRMIRSSRWNISASWLDWRNATSAAVATASLSPTLAVAPGDLERVRSRTAARAARVEVGEEAYFFAARLPAAMITKTAKATKAHQATLSVSCCHFTMSHMS